MPEKIVVKDEIEHINSLEALSISIVKDLRDSHEENFGYIEDDKLKGSHFHIARSYEERILFFKIPITETLLCLKQTEKNGRKDVKAYISNEVVEPILRRYREGYIKENEIGFFTIMRNPKETKITGLGFR